MQVKRKQKSLTPQFVEFIPDQLCDGELYISRHYSTATHLCACGCGGKVVTPLNNNGWSLVEDGGIATLRPSISNPWCGAHYWILSNQVKWAD